MPEGVSALTSQLSPAGRWALPGRSVGAAIRAAGRRPAGRRSAPALVVALAMIAASAIHTPAFAQEGPGGLVNPQRDCQTILACNFRRGGSYRGCISAYSCRTCRLVPARCSVGDRRRNCRKMTCSWG